MQGCTCFLLPGFCQKLSRVRATAFTPSQKLSSPLYELFLQLLKTCVLSFDSYSLRVIQLPLSVVALMNYGEKHQGKPVPTFW